MSWCARTNASNCSASVIPRRNAVQAFPLTGSGGHWRKNTQEVEKFQSSHAGPGGPRGTTGKSVRKFRSTVLGGIGVRAGGAREGTAPGAVAAPGDVTSALLIDDLRRRRRAASAAWVGLLDDQVSAFHREHALLLGRSAAGVHRRSDRQLVGLPHGLRH